MAQYVMYVIFIAVAVDAEIYLRTQVYQSKETIWSTKRNTFYNISVAE